MEESEAIGVAIGGKASKRFFLEDSFFQGREIFFRWIRPAAIEENIAICANGNCADAMDCENPVEPACAAAVECIANKGSFRISKNVEADEFAELCEIRLSRVNPLEIIHDFLERARLILNEIGASFDVLGHIRQCRAAL